MLALYCRNEYKNPECFRSEQRLHKSNYIRTNGAAQYTYSIDQLS